MSLLNTKNSRIDYKMVGVTVRSRYHSYLSLYTLAKGVTKASLLKELIMDWVTKQKSNETDAELIEQVRERVNEQWKVYIKKKSFSNMNRFRQNVEEELLAKGIPESYIQQITKDLV